MICCASSTLTAQSPLRSPFSCSSVGLADVVGVAVGVGVFQPVCVVVAVGVEVPVEEGLVANVASILDNLRGYREKLEKSAGSNRRPMR